MSPAGRAAAQCRHRHVRGEEARHGGFAVFTGSMHAEAVEALALQTDLRHAVARNEFRLQYQPIYDLVTKRSRHGGPRALAASRTRLVGPAAFIPLAEEIGLIRTSAAGCCANPATRCGMELAPSRPRPAHERQRLRRRTPGSGLHARIARGHRLDRNGSAQLAARDHRGRLSRRPEIVGRRLRLHSKSRSPHRSRRFRNRLLVARLPRPLSDRHDQDRPQLRGQDAGPPTNSGHRRDHHRLGPRSASTSWPRASRPKRSSRGSATCVAATSRATCCPARSRSRT